MHDLSSFRMCHYESLVNVVIQTFSQLQFQLEGKKINGHSDVLQLKCCPFI